MSDTPLFDACREMRIAALKADHTPRRWEANKAFIIGLQYEADAIGSTAQLNEAFGIPFTLIRCDSDDPRCSLIVDS